MFWTIHYKDAYNPIETSKELWESMDKNYKIEDPGIKNFVIGRCFGFKMVDSKTVMNKVLEFH